MGEPIQVSIRYPHGVTDNCAFVIPVGERRYRLELDPIPEMIGKTEDEILLLPRFGDTIEANTLEAGTLEYIAIAERAQLKRFDWHIPASIPDSGPLQSIFAKVQAEGGHWERVLGSIVIIAMPKDSDYDPSEEMERLLRDAELSDARETSAQSVLKSKSIPRSP